MLIYFLSIASLQAQNSVTPDQRMQWWREARFGMFVHWGLYSIPAGEWKGQYSKEKIGEWIMSTYRIPVTEYSALAGQFNPTQFDAASFVKTAKDAGMKYLTITAKHHDGFAMFKSNASAFNVVDATPYGKDIVGLLAAECHKKGIKICFYYSQSRDWHEPNGLDNTWDFPEKRDFQKYIDQKVKPQLTELLTHYGEVGMIWFDTPLSINHDQAQSIKDLVRKLQPACIISGRLGGGVKPDYESTSDNAVPPTTVAGDWEVPATLNNTWGYKKYDTNWKSAEEVTRLLFDIASKGGNYLLNVGPTAEGVIPKASIDILKQVGNWMKINSEAIYGSKASPFEVEFPWGNLTQKPGKLYAGIFNWPTGDFYLEGLENKVTKVYLLSDPHHKAIPYEEIYEAPFKHHILKIKLPKQAPDKMLSVLVIEIKGKTSVEKELIQDTKGLITLFGGRANIQRSGKPYNLEFTSNGGGANNWKDTAINLSWKFIVKKAGTYNVDIISTETGAHEKTDWTGGHVIDIDFNNHHDQVEIVPESKTFNPRAIYWKNAHTKASALTFDKPGLYKLILKPVHLVQAGRGFTFREINLVPQ
jgi:alpha-L-fucosidase